MYDTKILSNIWHDAEEFITDFKASELYELQGSRMQDKSVKTLYWLLYATYGNSPIANRDVYQFKYKVWSTIFQYGPEWEKKLDIQDKLRSLTEEELMKGGEGILNHANNPSTPPGTQGTEELSYVDDQSVQKRKRSKTEAYEILWGILNSDVTSEFVQKFAKLFSKFVLPNMAAIYVDEKEEGFIGDDVIPPNEEKGTQDNTTKEN